MSEDKYKDRLVKMLSEQCVLRVKIRKTRDFLIYLDGKIAVRVGIEELGEGAAEEMSKVISSIMTARMVCDELNSLGEGKYVVECTGEVVEKPRLPPTEAEPQAEQVKIEPALELPPSTLMDFLSGTTEVKQ